MRTIGIDIGIANTAIVEVISEGRAEKIADGFVVTTRPEESDTYDDVVERALEVAERVVAWLDSKSVSFGDDIVVESYVDQPARGHFKRRYMTPLVIGALAFALRSRGVPVRYQSAQVMKAAMKDYLAMWRSPTGARKDQRSRIVPGDELLTNEHLRDAAAHALLHVMSRRRGLK